MKIKVLVVEDNISLNKSILNVLNKEGYEAYSAIDISTAKEIFLKEKPHIVLLDIMLPNGSGIDLIPFFRKIYDTRIMMITAVAEDESKKIAYSKGADDYITKPFDLYELVYKLSAFKRRIIHNLKEYEIGDIIFNTDKCIIFCKGKSKSIQPSQIKLLKQLCEKYEENTFLDKLDVNTYSAVERSMEKRIQTMIARLRKNLVDIGSEEILIETIYGKGYKLTVIKS